MSLHAYINFNGNCREAIEYYTDIFGTRAPKIMTFGETPADPEITLPEGASHLVMFARLNIMGTDVMFSDVFPGMTLTVGNNIYLTVTSSNIDEVKRLYERLKDGGSVDMELQETFWSKCYGSLTDKYGICWQLSYEDAQANEEWQANDSSQIVE